MSLVLIYTQTGEPVKVGDTVVDFRGDAAVVTGWREPHKPSSSGRVHTREKQSGWTGEYFPSVYDLHFAELETTPQEKKPMKAIYWTNVETYAKPGPTNQGGLSTNAFTVRVLPSEDERLERRRASIAARRKARSLTQNCVTVRVQSIERIEPNDSRA